MSLPEGQFTEVMNGWKIHHHDIGEGHPILFLHGSGPGASGWSNFSENAQVWAKAGYRCVLVDSLGYGLSSKPTDVNYTLETMSSAAAALMEKLGHTRYTIVGNSQGGAQAIRIALNHPERVERLILMAPGGLEKREVYMEMRGIRSMLRCIYGPEGITLEGMKKVFHKQVFDASIVSDALIESRYEIALTQPTHVFKTMRVDNQTERLNELTCPVLGLWGMNDLFCPPSGATTLANNVANARVTLFSQCGHWVMVEHRAAFDRLCLDFLKNG